MNYQRGFFIPGLPNPYFLLAAGVAIAVAAGMGYWRGWSSGMQSYYELKGQVEAQNEANRIDMERKLNEAKRINEAANQGWANAEKELAALRKRGPVIRVQRLACQAGMPAISGASTKSEELPIPESGSAGPGIEITADQCEARINGALADVVWINTVKKWADDQHRASKK